MIKPRAILFDVYGTLLDVHSVTAVAEQWFPTHGQHLSQRWRDKQIEYTRLLTQSGQGQHYMGFDAVTAHALDYVIALITPQINPRPSPAHIDAARAALLAQYGQLTPFAESKTVLESLKSQGVLLGVLSNGEPATLQATLTHAGLHPYLDYCLSVDSVRRYKTDDAAYALGPQALNLAPAEIGFVSANGWDALGATWYGYQTVWINRGGMPSETIGPKPHFTGRDLRDVLTVFSG